MRTLFLSWQDQLSRSWFVVGRLDTDDHDYWFRYVNQAYAAGKKRFEPLLEFPDINKAYHSAKLFALFENRLMSASRPDYASFLRRLHLTAEQADPLIILSRTEGQRATDSYEVFLKPEPDPVGDYCVYFFVRGLSHMPDAAPYLSQMSSGEQLYLQPDSNNETDSDAILLTNAQGASVGYLPRYLCKDVQLFLKHCKERIDLSVAQINAPPAPLQQRLLCNFTAPWPKTWQPFAEAEFEPIVELPVMI